MKATAESDPTLNIDIIFLSLVISMVTLSFFSVLDSMSFG